MGDLYNDDAAASQPLVCSYYLRSLGHNPKLLSCLSACTLTLYKVEYRGGIVVVVVVVVGSEVK